MRIGITLVPKRASIFEPVFAIRADTSSLPSFPKRVKSGVFGIATSTLTHRRGNSRLMNEPALPLENGFVVGVEADDHAAGHLHAGRLDAMDLLQQRAAAISKIL